MTAALASVAAQTWPLDKLEAVVADNGSTDGTSAAVRAFMAREPRLAVHLVCAPIAGVSRAKNRGARAAHGRWLLFLDADSRLAPDLVERVMARAGSGCPAASIRIVADGRDPLDRAFFGIVEFGKRLFGLRAQMFYCPREAFLELGGFDEALVLAEDCDLMDRLLRAGIPIGHLSESWIATSPRRLHRGRWRLGMLTMFARWALAKRGVGRRWRY